MNKQKRQEIIVRCPDCLTKFYRPAAGFEICAVCGTGKEVMFTEYKPEPYHRRKKK